MRAIMAVLAAILFSSAVVNGQGNVGAKALTFTIAADKTGKFGYYALGEVAPIEIEQCQRVLAGYASEKDNSGNFPGMDAKTRQSGNLLALRCDGGAPVSFAGALLNVARRAGLARAAVAMTQDFPASDFEAARENPAMPLRRPVLTDVGEGYRVLGACPPRRDDDECLTLMLAWKSETRQASITLEGGSEINCRLDEVLVDAKATAKTREASLKRRREVSAQVVNLLEAARANVKSAQARLVIAPQSLRTAGAEVAPWIMALLALDGALDFNSRRGKATWQLDFLPVELPKLKAAVDLPAVSAKAFEPRRAAKRENAARIEAALGWLAAHQNAGGHWSGHTFREDSVRKQARVSANLEFVAPGKAGGDLGEEGNDIGLSGLALMAFAGAGCDLAVGDFHETCRRAVTWLLKVQGNDGCFGPKEDDSFVYGHAMATCALGEFLGLTGNALLKEPVERAVAFILSAQNPGMGWRYGVKSGENDSSVTGWMICALHTAKLAGVDFDSATAFAGAARWFEAVTVDVQGRPKTGYNSPGSDNARNRDAVDYENNPAMDAVHVYCRLAMGGWDADNATLKAQSNVIAQCPPQWSHHKIDYYYWFHASNAMFQMGDPCWNRWSKPLLETLNANQRGWRPEDAGNNADTLDEYGSWDAVDAWHSAGGRVYSTALCCQMLETPNRFARFSGK